ncbi:MAG: flagellar hook-length control protein FliK, partial [Calditrichia bacterium]|nr:flagellar hook-length control protein FliK [Calditrichia bacterium]
KNSASTITNTRTEIPQPQKLIKRIAEQIKLKFSQKQADINIRLQPESLGKLNISMQLIGKTISLILTAETNESKELLTKHAYSLKENLAAQGIKVEKVEINTMMEKNNHSSGNQNSNSTRQHQQQSQHSSQQYQDKNNSTLASEKEKIKEEIIAQKNKVNSEQILDIKL